LFSDVHNQTVQACASAVKDRFLGIDAFVRASDTSLDAITEELIMLSTKMCRADAAHSNTVIETIQSFRARCLLLLNELGEKIKKVTDRESVESCKSTFKKVVDEVRKVSLAVTAEPLIKSDSPNPSNPITSVITPSPYTLIRLINVILFVPISRRTYYRFIMLAHQVPRRNEVGLFFLADWSAALWRDY
jgi:hypothetical protein